jgi:hypothetical protein
MWSGLSSLLICTRGLATKERKAQRKNYFARNHFAKNWPRKGTRSTKKLFHHKGGRARRKNHFSPNHFAKNLATEERKEKLFCPQSFCRNDSRLFVVKNRSLEKLWLLK